LAILYAQGGCVAIRWGFPDLPGLGDAPTVQSIDRLLFERFENSIFRKAFDMTQTLFPLAIIILAGSMAALQAPMNAALGVGLGSGTAAATISFGVGFAVRLAVITLSGDVSTLSRAGDVNGWLLLGGILGAFYVWAILWVIPTLGVVTAVSGMILGQLVVALMMDAFGPFGLPISAITPQRMLAVAMVAGGLVLSKV
jgi:transporter family-2 protein